MFMCIVLLQSMPVEQCARGTLVPLPTALQTRYQQLDQPQCTNITHINTFLFQLLPMAATAAGGAQMSYIFYHLQQAAYYLNRIHVS